MARFPKTFVTGAAGQVGTALRDRLPEDAVFLSREDLDVTDRNRTEQMLAGAEVVIHLAAMTDVDGCEVNPQSATEVNAGGTRNVVEAARAQGARVVLLSTDYVFDGTKSEPYVEDDPPNPINAYGASKLEAERIVLEDATALIVRTSWVVGAGSNFVRTMLRLAGERDRIAVVDDQLGRPTFARDLAEAISILVRQEASGVIHLSGDGPACTWAGLAIASLEPSGKASKIEPVTTDEYVARVSRVIAPRPRNSVFDLSKARSFGIPLHDWRTSLDGYLGSV